MSADRDLTPRVVAYLRDALLTIDVEQRPSFPVAQLVLRQMGRWARRTDTPGCWLCADSISQLAAGTGLAEGQVRRAAAALERIGLARTLVRGGGRGTGARGSTRELLLDPTEKLRAVDRAQFDPKLRAVEAETARGRAETARGQPRDTASSSASSSARWVSADCEPSDSPIPPWVADRFGYLMPDPEGE